MRPSISKKPMSYRPPADLAQNFVQSLECDVLQLVTVVHGHNPFDMIVADGLVHIWH